MFVVWRMFLLSGFQQAGGVVLFSLHHAHCVALSGVDVRPLGNPKAWLHGPHQLPNVKGCFLFPVQTSAKGKGVSSA